MKNTALIIAALLMIIGTIAYIATGAYKAPEMESQGLTLFPDGEGERLFIMTSPEGHIKFFYESAVPIGEPREGSADGYRTQDIDGVTYQPVLIGSAEAAMMREEKLFSQPGDTISGFFGQDVIVVGVLEETGTSLDMMHVVLPGVFR
jgi:hypothetical protein